MADQSKAERLAAARKKLQDFQRKKESHSAPISSNLNVVGVPTEPYQTGFTVQPDEQLAQQSGNNNVEIRAKSSIPSVTPYLPYELPDHAPFTEAQEMVLHRDYQQSMNGSSQYEVSEEHTSIQGNFFDNVVTSDRNLSEAPTVFSATSYFGNFGVPTNESFSSGVSDSQHGMQAYLSPTHDVSVNSTAHLFRNSNDSSDKWDLNSASSTSSVKVANSYKTEVENIKQEDSSTELTSHDDHPREPSEDMREVQNIAPPTSDIKTGGKEVEVPLNGRSSTESIRQLSDQITHLIDPSGNEEEKLNSSLISSLETRNQELAAQLAAEHSMNQQLQFALKECQSQVSHLELKVQELQSQQEVVLARHLGPLQEQLRAHAQTVGILVGEKTELEAAIAHHTATAKQHSSEVEELQNRLRASRHRVSELEKDVASATVAATAADKQKNNHEQEVDQLRLQNGMLCKQLEDAEEEASELRQKLSSRVTEVNALTTQLQDKQSQLSLAQLRITQLSSSDNPEASAEIESLHQLKISLERRCLELTEAVRQLTADRDQADQQYQQYVAQLNGQLLAANSKLESSSVENEKLRNREEDLVRNMSELERQLQQQIQLQQQQLHHNKIQQEVVQEAEKNSDSKAKLDEKILELEEEKQKLQSSFTLKVEELASLQECIAEKNVRITELETLCSERPDQSRLLAAMESDKVAAAQATSQNAVLKQQLQELQDGFIKMSNDKLNLTESLEHEKHVNKDMGEKISQLAEELHELRVLVSDKERRLQEYREHAHNHDQNCNDSHDSHNHTHESKEANNQINEKKNSTGISFLQENYQTHEPIHNLDSQNNSLRQLIAQKSTESHESGSSSSATEGATTDDAAADHETNCEELSGSHADYRYMQYAMEKLQERFTRTMSEVAELTDEKQRLEHLVLQLQGETETIGEYVTLYQMQRAALQQRAREKDHQLANLSSEREELRRKLQELNQLVHRLLEERGQETGKEALSHLDTLYENTANQNESGVIEVPNVPEAVGQETNTNQDVAKRLSNKILSIIEDINVSNDIETSFHPCPWCSGRLKNV